MLREFDDVEALIKNYAIALGKTETQVTLPKRL
jgi:hypothetical protein